MIFDQMSKSCENIIEEIKSMNFIKEMINNTLREDIFEFYIHQDAIYLEHYAKSLLIISSKLEDTGYRHFLSDNAISVIKEEISMQQQYTMDKNNNNKISPACFMYTNYLLRVSYSEDVSISLAAILPCFWIYWVIGKYIKEQSTENNKYMEWINTYSSDEFEYNINKIIEIINDVAKESSMPVKKKMLTAFTEASKLEYMFWQDSYDKKILF